MIRADRARITHVLQNLLTNALRHTPPGGTINLQVGHANATAQLPALPAQLGGVTQ